MTTAPIKILRPAFQSFTFKLLLYLILLLTHRHQIHRQSNTNIYEMCSSMKVKLNSHLIFKSLFVLIHNMSNAICDWKISILQSFKLKVPRNWSRRFILVLSLFARRLQTRNFFWQSDLTNCEQLLDQFCLPNASYKNSRCYPRSRQIIRGAFFARIVYGVIQNLLNI